MGVQQHKKHEKNHDFKLFSSCYVIMILLLHNYESCQGPPYKAEFDLYKLSYSALWLWL